jgi:prepilin peptidase CpaA
MGAGDVKLMAMTGAFLGLHDTLWALLATFVAGGVLSIVFALRSHSLRRLFGNLALLAQGAALGGGLRANTADTRASVGTLPYGVAIAGGTIGYLVLRQLGFLG